MPIAIEAKYLSPTSHKGARIRLKAPGGQTRTVGYDYGAFRGGLTIETVRAYVAECFPYEDAGAVAGPFHMDGNTSIFTLP